MCGIAGVYQLNGKPVQTNLAQSMGALMNHRGPDNFSFIDWKNLGVSHNRLSLLDLSASSNQPFVRRNYVLSYNGEIYNYRKIRKWLEVEYNVEFQTTSDTEVLFYSLVHEGVAKTLKQIKGMFAFSFYDQVKNELWLARDRLGIKPLYYYQNSSGFYWSSEVKALAQTLKIRLDPIKTLFSINGIGEKSNEYTLFKGITPVKPGTFLKIKANYQTPQVSTYYDALNEFEPDVYQRLNSQKASEVVAEFDELLNRSIESMLVSDAPLGAFVSGGLDSSLISAIAKRKYREFKLFTANVTGKFSEYEDAKTLAAHLDTELFDYRFEPEQMLTDWAEVTYFYETPIVVHTNAIPFARVAQLTREKGVKAVLTGEGADELFLGYPRLLAERYNKFATAPMRLLKSFYGLLPGLAEYLFPKPDESTPNFINSLVQNFEQQQMKENLNKLDFLPPAARREQFLTIKMLGEHLVTLLHRNDRMGMMASIEARFPFLDEALVKFAINLPVKYKIGKSLKFHNYKHPFLIDKWIVRRAAEKYLPRELSAKRKIGFPMVGHKFVRIGDGFFKNGWVENNLSMTAKTRRFMLESQNPYMIAKLASVDIFGRIFGLGESIESVKKHVLENARLQVN
jgi:asparagine synthase (glutamine-hydrolysing)